MRDDAGGGIPGELVWDATGAPTDKASDVGCFAFNRWVLFQPVFAHKVLFASDKWLPKFGSTDAACIESAFSIDRSGCFRQDLPVSPW